MFNEAWFWLLLATMFSVVFVQDQLLNEKARKVVLVITVLGMLAFAFVGANIAERPWYPIAVIGASFGLTLILDSIILHLCRRYDKRKNKKTSTYSELTPFPGVSIHLILVASLYVVTNIYTAVVLIVLCVISIPIGILIKQKKLIKAKELRQKEKAQAERALKILADSLQANIGKHFLFTYETEFLCRDDSGRRYCKWVQSTDEIEVIEVSISGVKYKNRNGSIEEISCDCFSENLLKGKIRPV